MARLNAANTERARELMGHYPRARSAMIPMCHLAQEQDGYLTDEAMEHIAELIGCTPAEVYGTASSSSTRLASTSWACAPTSRA
jgi:NADH-quinone oxidoreductase subunit E